jgi:hypothetical protein
MCPVWPIRAETMLIPIFTRDFKTPWLIHAIIETAPIMCMLTFGAQSLKSSHSSGQWLETSASAQLGSAALMSRFVFRRFEFKL